MSSRCFATLCRRLARDDEGFSLVEALIAVFILAVGAFAVLQALNFGLTTSAVSRQRQTAEQLVGQEIEQARGLNYGNIGLAEAGPLTASTDPLNPDYDISTDGLSYDADGSGTTVPSEDMILSQVSPNLPHGPTTVTRGGTTFDIYDYVTWVDVAGISGDQNAKRVTVVALYKSDATHAPVQVKASSLYSSGAIPIATASASANNPPVVSCPTSTVSGLTVNFTAVASDPDSGDSIAQYDWDYGDTGTSSSSSPQASHTYLTGGSYTVTSVVHDTHSAQASTASQNCTVTVVGPSPTPTNDTEPPTGTIQVAGSNTYTRSTQVTLTLNATDNAGVAEMSFSDDGVQFGTWLTYATTALYTVPSGDGTKTVYARFRDASGNISAVVSDTILLDSVAPDAPTGLTGLRASNKKTTTLTWNTVSASDLAGYAVFRRTGISGTNFVQVSCTFSYGLPNKCDDTGEVNGTSYTFYVVSLDLAGNTSAPSNQVTT
jgi:type II secretory pathway pseudopilin PulG